jgi:hypothetical protein
MLGDLEQPGTNGKEYGGNAHPPFSGTIGAAPLLAALSDARCVAIDAWGNCTQQSAKAHIIFSALSATAGSGVIRSIFFLHLTTITYKGAGEKILSGR